MIVLDGAAVRTIRSEDGNPRRENGKLLKSFRRMTPVPKLHFKSELDRSVWHAMQADRRRARMARKKRRGW